MRLILAGLLALTPFAASAQTATDSFDVRITIAAECQVISTEALDFGQAGVLTSTIDATSTLQVACTDSTPYDIGLSEGAGSAATTATRQMTSAEGDTINYQMFSDSSYSVNWGDTVATDTQSATGNGATQSFTVYGRVPAQTTPAPGVYDDTVQVTVTF